MKTIVLMVFSIALLLAGQACQKTATAKTAEQLRQDSIDAAHRADSIYLATRYDFRNALVGSYTCELHYSSWLAGSSRDTIIRVETIDVQKASSDTNAVFIKDKYYTFYSLHDTTVTLLDFDFCRPIPVYLNGHDIDCTIDQNCSGQAGGFRDYYLGHKIH